MISAERSVELRVEPAELLDEVRFCLSQLGVSEPQLAFKIGYSSVPHAGFGWRTQLRLGVATAACLALRITVDPLQLAPLMGRGGTSGIGSHGFWHGGLIVDGGRRRSQKQTPVPSAQQSFPGLPPLLFNRSFPWAVLIGIAADMEPVSGPLEANLFRQHAPVPEREALEANRIVYSELVSAVAETDFAGFCEAVAALRQLGFKRREVEYRGAQGEAVLKILAKTGAQGVSMSSWGPAFFGFFASIADAQRAAAALKADCSFSAVWATEASPGGAVADYCGARGRALDLVSSRSVK
jgi:beta-ribofuranosylaminobenzene 5'-phosphate synthase